MRWVERTGPAPMQRVALVAPNDRVRGILVAVAEAGAVQLERTYEPAGGPAAQAYDRARRRHRSGRAPAPRLVRELPDVDSLERQARLGELAGEVELERVAGEAVRHGPLSAWVGWSPASTLARLTSNLAALGGAVVPLPAPMGSDPPTLIEGAGATHAFQPIIDTYATVGYRDLNPAALAGVAYVVMFGMMFGDVGHGIVLLVAALLLRSGRPRRLAGLRRLSPFVIGAGLASTLFGLAYGEFFGPTGVVPTLWLRPLDHPTTLLAVAIVVGAALLAVSYVLGAANRWREGGAVRALVAMSGLAGGGLYLGLVVLGLGWLRHWAAAELAGAALAVTCLALGGFGLYAESGGHAAGAVQTGVELFDSVVRLGSNTVSFARLAAFGLTHAALCGIVWTATLAIGRHGAAWDVAAAAIFVLGNVLAFSLEGLVAGIQALRLEYYEMFSRIFEREGRQFEPWHLPVVSLPVMAKEV